MSAIGRDFSVVEAPDPLFLLAADHRRSFERLLGVTGSVDAAAHARLAAAKLTIVEALAELVGARPDLRGAGVLLDDHYGAGAIDVARTAGLTVAVAFERSGQDVLAFEHDDWPARLDDLAASAGTGAALAKLLIRHRADGAADGRSLQLERLRTFSDSCVAAGVAFLLELLTPFDADELADADTAALEDVVRPALIIAAIREIQDAGIEAKVWKVEGVGDGDACRAIAAAARGGGRGHVGVVVLGAGAPTETVERWLRTAASGGYTGFAVGRSIWADALRGLDTGELDADEARRRIAAGYLRMVDTFRAASPA